MHASGRRRERTRPPLERGLQWLQAADLGELGGGPNRPPSVVGRASRGGYIINRAGHFLDLLFTCPQTHQTTLPSTPFVLVPTSRYQSRRDELDHVDPLPRAPGAPLTPPHPPVGLVHSGTTCPHRLTIAPCTAVCPLAVPLRRQGFQRCACPLPSDPELLRAGRALTSRLPRLPCPPPARFAGLSFDQLASQVGRSEVWVASLFYGQVSQPISGARLEAVGRGSSFRGLRCSPPRIVRPAGKAGGAGFRSAPPEACS